MPLPERTKVVPGVRERSVRVIRLKEELNLILELVVHSREALTSELSTEFAQKKLSIDAKFLDKLKALTSMYETLTKARIGLDKAEHSLEKEMTPGEEKQAVYDFIMGLEARERADAIRRLVGWHREKTPSSTGKPINDARWDVVDPPETSEDPV